MKRLFGIMLLIVAVAVVVKAQVPHSITVQMVVRDASDNLVCNRQVGVELSVVHLSPSGNVVYAETHQPTTNANGLFSIQMGQGSVVQGAFASIHWGNGPYFLSIRIDPAGGTAYSISGVQQFLSVPYALYADSVGHYAEQQQLSFAHDTLRISSGNYIVLPYTSMLRDSTMRVIRDSIVAVRDEVLSAVCIPNCSSVERQRFVVDSIISHYNGVIHHYDSLFRAYDSIIDTMQRRLSANDACKGHTSGIDEQSSCGPIMWHGVRYTSSTNSPTYHFVTSGGCDSVVTLHLIINEPQGQSFVHSADATYLWPASGAMGHGTGETYSASSTIVGPSYVDANGCNAHDTLHLTLSLPDGALNSFFSVGEGAVVRFSQGNLRYKASNGIWRFADHQYDIVGDANASISSSYDGWIDLYGYGTSGWNSGAAAYQPYSTSTTVSDYYPAGSAHDLTGTYEQADWGVYNAIENGGNSAGQWRCLSGDEWNYLFTTRGGSTVNGTDNARYCPATVNGIEGCILFPNTYTHPMSVPQPQGINNSNDASLNIYTAAQFALMEAEGVVFLPFPKKRVGNEISVGVYYWTSTASTAMRLFPSLNLGELNALVHGVGCNEGYGVRLVQDVANCEGHGQSIEASADYDFHWRSSGEYGRGTGERYYQSQVVVGMQYDIDGCPAHDTLRLHINHEGALASLISVAAGRQVHFARGNLEYNPSLNEWRFHDSQYTSAGNDNKNPSATSNKWIDLFGWSTSGYHDDGDTYNTQFRPYSTSYGTVDVTRNRYGYGPSSTTFPISIAGTKHDWGVNNAISNGGNESGLWRLLSTSEWQYMLFTRPASTINGVENARFSRAMVGTMAGVLIYPDNYIHPDGLPQPDYINSTSGSTYTTFTTDQFAQMEALGVVFLCRAQTRYGATSLTTGALDYWTSDASNSSNAGVFQWTNNTLSMTSVARYNGCAVRLVYSPVLCRSEGTTYHVSTPSSFLWSSSGEYGNGSGENYTSSGSYVGPTYYDNDGCAIHDTLQLVVQSQGVLPGLFSVADSRQVRFSKGNLQYQSSTNTWNFASAQTSSLGNSDGNISPSAMQTQRMDVFPWGTSGWNSGAVSYLPYSYSWQDYHYLVGDNAYNDLTGRYANADWGVYNAISNGGNLSGMWRTLSKDEWQYLLFTRTASTVGSTANARFCKATVDGNKKGLLIFPDNYTHPSIATVPTNVNNTSSVFASYIVNMTAFNAMEEAGVVFLPLTGRRREGVFSNNDTYGYYWSSTHCDGEQAHLMMFYGSGLSATSATDRAISVAVRLVQDAGIQRADCESAVRGIDSQSSCDSVVWHGRVYKRSTTTATHHYISAQGCDSVVELHLTINTPQNTAYVRDAFANYHWALDGDSGHGTDETYTSTGTYTGLAYTDRNGCMAHDTLHLYLSSAHCYIDGAFSVAADRRVRFSKGNLQYRASSGTWRFAEQQYSIVGDDNANISSSYAGWIDLFGWGTSGWSSGATAYQPYSTSTTNSDYTPAGNYNLSLTGANAHADWGMHNAISNGGNAPEQWRTPTKEEWTYLIETRNASTLNGTANARYCKAKVGDQKGLLLFPDNYTHPSGIPLPIAVNNADVDYPVNTYTPIQFARLQASGVVFLPAAGCRNGTTVSRVGYYAYYWSSTNNTNANTAFGTFFFGSNILNPQQSITRNTGASVRLVQDID